MAKALKKAVKPPKKHPGDTAAKEVGTRKVGRGKSGAKQAAAQQAAAERPAAERAPALLPRALPSPSGEVLDRLFGVVLSRREADPALSHSARLLSRGPAKVAQKFGEEAVEALIEAVAGNKAALVGESADVLYHLLVLWVAAGVQPAEVWAELQRREGISGVAEKAGRPRKLPILAGTTKIP